MACGRWQLFGLAVALAACGGNDGKTPAHSGQPVDSADSGAEVCGPLVVPDTSGCLEIQETDPEARGRWPDILRRQYNADGHEVANDVRGGEHPDSERFCRKEWDGDRLLSEQCAGVSVYAYAYSYDTDGHLLQTTYDAGSDGALDKVWAHLTDAHGNVVETTVDDDVDGTPDAIQTFAYDTDGRLVEETWDYTYDGAVDYLRTLTWDGDQLVGEAEDTDGDGVVDRERTTEFDDLGRPEVAYLYNDGSSTAAETTRWTYTDCQLDTHTVTDAGGNRTELVFIHDDLGRETMRVEDWDADGAPDRIWATAWQCPGDAR